MAFLHRDVLRLDRPARRSRHWEQVNTQTSPGVFFWDGTWIMYYDAAQYGHAGDTGYNCLAVATAAESHTRPIRSSPTTPPVPLLCQPQLGGAIDPSPFIDPVTGNAYLVWKSNDGGSSQPAQLWSQQLSANGLSLVGSPQLLLTQDTVDYPWETTMENPDMVDVGGTYILLFSTGASITRRPTRRTSPLCRAARALHPEPVRAPAVLLRPPRPGPVGGRCFRMPRQLVSRVCRLATRLHELLLRGCPRLFVASASLTPARCLRR